MSSISPNAIGGPALYTALGPSRTPGGFSQRSFGTPGLPFGFGFPSFGDPLFYFTPAASSFFINRLLGWANGSAVNINIGPTPSTLGFGGLLLGQPFFADSGNPGGDPFTFNNFGPESPGYGTSFAGGGYGSAPGYGAPFGTPPQPGPVDPLLNPNYQPYGGGPSIGDYMGGGAGGYGAPPTNYGPPMPPSYGPAPQPGYGAPPPGYGAPMPPSYGPAPQPGYGAPPPGYGLPPQGYGAPTPPFGGSGYPAPMPPAYGQPPQGFGGMPQSSFFG